MIILFSMLPNPVFAEQHEVAPIPLTCAAAMVLKGVLTQLPDAAGNLVASLNNARSVLEGIEKYEQVLDEKNIAPARREALFNTAIVKFKNIILDPMREFFLFVAMFSDVLRPMVIESFTNRGLPFAESNFYQFLDASEGTADTFFDERMDTKEGLIKTCQDFSGLFGDFEATMPEAFEGGRVYLQNVHEAAAAAQATQNQEAEKKAL